MKAACLKFTQCFKYASSRLKDDEQFVRIAAFAGDKYTLMRPIDEASDRLRNDESFITNLLIDFCSNYNHEQRENKRAKRKQLALAGTNVARPFQAYRTEGPLGSNSFC